MLKKGDRVRVREDLKINREDRRVRLHLGVTGTVLSRRKIIWSEKCDYVVYVKLDNGIFLGDYFGIRFEPYTDVILWEV